MKNLFCPHPKFQKLLIQDPGHYFKELPTFLVKTRNLSQFVSKAWILWKSNVIHRKFNTADTNEPWILFKKKLIFGVNYLLNNGSFTFLHINCDEFHFFPFLAFCLYYDSKCKLYKYIWWLLTLPTDKVPQKWP